MRIIMGRTYKEYRFQLQSLLPKGRFWTRQETAKLTEILNGFGEEFARIEERSEDLITESIPSTAVETLTEWETDYNLPDQGKDIEESTEGRQSVIKAKYIAVGQQDKGYFEEIALALGYTITITEFPNFLAGLSQAGEALATTKGSIYYWIVNIWADDLISNNISQLIIDIVKRKPGHTHVLFRFYNFAFSNAFSPAFDAVPWWDGTYYPFSFSRDFSNAFSNAYDYNGVKLTGGFNSAFSEAFDSYRGGAFNFDEFGNGFSKPT